MATRAYMTRRDWSRAILLGGASWPVCRARAWWVDDPALIVRNERPLNVETPAHLLTDWRTPNGLFFVRSHFGPPAVGLHPWSIRVDGFVDRPNRFGLDRLERYETHVVTAVLQCAGNGRAMFEPVVPGVPWARGAVGNGEWRGARLRDVLEAAGLSKKATHIHVLGGDPPPNPKTPAFLRSLPVERALDANTILATQMNDAPLPVLHGGPVRLVVPGWTGNHWIKWVRAIIASDQEAPGFYQRTGYRMPRIPTPPGTDVKPADTVPVTWMNVKSLIVAPAQGATVDSGVVAVRGVAWTGQGTVSRVEVCIDGGSWRAATLVGPNEPFAWRQWELPWEATRGRHTLRARATDSNSQTQPDQALWNKSGYLWNGVDVIEVSVG